MSTMMPDVRHGDLSLPGGRLHYVEAGEGPALVLVHGGHGSWTHWIANIGALATRLRVLALDLPGFGASFDPVPAYGLEEYAQTVSHVLDALAIPQAAVAGFSFGCVVAAAAARAEPQRVTHLAIVNPPGIGPSSPEAARIMAALSKRAVHSGLRAGALGSLAELQLWHRERIDERLVDLMIANVRRTRFISRELSRSAGTDRILAAVKQPMLLLIGREDVYRQFGLATLLRRVTEVAPHARIHVVERARHWLQFDRAEHFNALLADFVSDGARPSASDAA